MRRPRRVELARAVEVVTDQILFPASRSAKLRNRRNGGENTSNPPNMSAISARSAASGSKTRLPLEARERRSTGRLLVLLPTRPLLLGVPDVGTLDVDAPAAGLFDVVDGRVVERMLVAGAVPRLSGPVGGGVDDDVRAVVDD